MAVDRSEIAHKLMGIVAHQLNISPDTVTEDSTLDALGADSLDRVEIVMKVEEQFDIEIDDAAAERLNMMRDAVDYVYGLKNSSSAAS